MYKRQVESHAGHGEGAEVELSAASAAMAKAVAMDTRGKTLLERVEPILSNLEKFSPTTPTSRQFIAALTENIIQQQQQSSSSSSSSSGNNHEGSGRGVGAGRVSAGREGQVAACGELEG